MSRQLKFRAWDVKERRMRENDCGLDDMLKIELDGSLTGCRIDCFDDYIAKTKGEDEFILMQYTGLQDKNGKEIYEGDILREGRHSVGTVEYNVHYAKYILKRPPCWCGDPCNDIDLCGYDNLEVIGNIYENPELMKNVRND